MGSLQSKHCRVCGIVSNNRYCELHEIKCRDCGNRTYKGYGRSCGICYYTRLKPVKKIEAT